MKHGIFSGEPRTEWLTEVGPDLRMRLLDRFTFTDPAGRTWEAPASRVVDGASIPRPLWSIVGSPYTGDYRRASIVHDVATDAATTPAERAAADRMFFHACRAGGCPLLEAIALYVGVRIGAYIERVPAWKAAGLAATRVPHLAATAWDARLQADHRLACEVVLADGPTEDAAELEARVDHALSMLTNVAFDK
jgi:hypothetical protein